VKPSSRPRAWLPPKSAFAGFRFPAEVIVVAVRWYLQFNLSYRDVEELLAERGVEVDHVTSYRWVQRFASLLADTARFARHAPAAATMIMRLVAALQSRCIQTNAETMP
jgi:transposase-like protein